MVPLLMFNLNTFVIFLYIEKMTVTALTFLRFWLSTFCPFDHISFDNIAINKLFYS